MTIGMVTGSQAVLARSPANQEQPPEPGNSTPVPNPPALMTKSANAIPLTWIKLPRGFAIELRATGLTNARSIAVGSKGTVFVDTRFVGAVYASWARGTIAKSGRPSPASIVPSGQPRGSEPDAAPWFLVMFLGAVEMWGGF